MLARVKSVATIGLEAREVMVEGDVAEKGFPGLTIVGLPDKARSKYWRAGLFLRRAGAGRKPQAQPWRPASGYARARTRGRRSLRLGTFGQ